MAHRPRCYQRTHWKLLIAFLGGSLQPSRNPECAGEHLPLLFPLAHPRNETKLPCIPGRSLSTQRVPQLLQLPAGERHQITRLCWPAGPAFTSPAGLQPAEPQCLGGGGAPPLPSRSPPARRKKRETTTPSLCGEGCPSHCTTWSLPPGFQSVCVRLSSATSPLGTLTRLATASTAESQREQRRWCRQSRRTASDGPPGHALTCAGGC